MDFCGGELTLLLCQEVRINEICMTQNSVIMHNDSTLLVFRLGKRVVVLNSTMTFFFMMILHINPHQMDCRDQDEAATAVDAFFRCFFSTVRGFLVIMLSAVMMHLEILSF